MVKKAKDPIKPTGKSPMNLLKRFGLFWFHFVVGDDWRIAASVIAGLGMLTAITHGPHLQVWWLLPVLVVVMLSVSLWTATKT